MSAHCESCGQKIRYKIEAPTGAPWQAFLLAWEARHGTDPVAIAALAALAAESGVDAPSRMRLGQMLGLTEGVKRHSRGKGTKQPGKWKLAPASK